VLYLPDPQIHPSAAHVPPIATLPVTSDATYVTVATPAHCRGQTTASPSNENPVLATGPGQLSVKVNYVTSVVLTLPACVGLNFVPGNTYFIKLLGTLGNTAVYYQAM